MSAYLTRSMGLLFLAAAAGWLTLGGPAPRRAAAQDVDDPFAVPADDAPAPAPAPGVDDPFGGPAAGAPAMDEPAIVDPAAAAEDVFGTDEPPAALPGAPAAAPRRRAAPAAEAEAGLAVPTDPAVLTVLEWTPKTPAQLLRAIDILVDLDHAAHAKPFVDELVQRNLDPQAKVQLVDQFNSATLFKLARDKELGPALAPLIDDWILAAELYRHDAARLAAAAKQLTAADETDRAQATLELMRGRESAVAPLVSILADPNRAAEHVAARQVLLYLNGYAVEPLLGVLEAPDAALKTRAIEVLGQLSAHEAVPQLLGPLVAPGSPAEMRAAAGGALRQILGRTPEPFEALRMLEASATEPLAASRNVDPETAAPAVVWHWNRKQNESMPLVYDTTGAALAKATRQARELYLVDPARADWRRLYLTAMLQAAKLRAGLDRPLARGEGTSYSVAAYYGPDLIDDLLSHALADGNIPAATAAAQVLGDIGSPELLVRGGGAPSPLARAAGHPDGRLRFAAIEAIMKLAPGQPFAGSSNVTSGMGYFARTFGAPRVLVAHPNSAEAGKMAGLAAALGYEADVATNGRDAFELAVNSPDYDFALVHSAIDRPELDHLIAQFRRDKRTADLPIGIVAPIDELERVEAFARITPRAEAFFQPQTEDEMRIRAGDLLARAGRWHMSAAERRAHAEAALDWLAQLAVQPQNTFDVYRQESALVSALYMPELSARASAVLAELGTETAQRSLLELVNLASQPPAVRQAAAAAFARNVGQFGLRLARDEILHQYDLYNGNAGRDGDTHAVLTTVLDAIEQKPAPTGGQ